MERHEKGRLFMKTTKRKWLNLRWFDEGSGDGAGEATTGESVTEGTAVTEQGGAADLITQEQSTTADRFAGTQESETRDAQYRNFRNEFKAELQKDTQRVIDERFKQTKLLETQNAELAELAKAVAARYGVDAEDLTALRSAIDSDEDFLYEAASREGMTVEKYKEYMTLKANSERLQRVQAEEAANREQTEAFNQQFFGWKEQEEDVKAIDPGFDLVETLDGLDEAERNEWFKLMMAGIPLKNAYMAFNADKIIPAAMNVTAKNVRAQTAKEIASRQSRPPENGAGQAGKASVSVDYSSKKGREELARRALRGEKITL